MMSRPRTHNAASAIAISSDSSDESVGSPPSRVILFGDIPTVIPSTSVVAPETSTIAPVISSVAPVVETTLVASPTGLSISPFLCTDSSKAPDSSDGPPSQDPYVATVAHWRSRVTARPSSSSEFPIAPITALPGIRRRSAILIRPGEAIPFGRPYRTHLNRPRKLLTARKRVGPLPARRLAGRHASPRSSDHRSSSSSSSSDFLPSGLDALDQAHFGSLTRDSSSGDSSERPLHSSSHSAGPSRKRCRSPVDSVTSSMPVMGSLAPTRAHLLPPRKRFRDSYSSEASMEEEDTEIDPIETEVDMELGIGDGDDVRVHVEIDPRDVRDDTEEYEADTWRHEPAGEDYFDSSGTRDGIVRSFEDMPIDLNDVVRDFYHHMSKANGLGSRNDRSNCGTPALEAHQVNQNLELRNGNNNGNDNGNGNGNDNGNNNGNGNGNDNGNGNGNGNNGGDNGDGNENYNVNGRCDRLVAHEYYKMLLRIANNLWTKKLKGYAVELQRNKEYWTTTNGEITVGNNHSHKLQNTGGQNVSKAYVAGNNEERNMKEPIALSVNK
ncbi:hypothetical protein Tco_0351248 [Tanacetum coccineum]